MFLLPGIWSQPRKKPAEAGPPWADLEMGCRQRQGPAWERFLKGRHLLRKHRLFGRWQTATCTSCRSLAKRSRRSEVNRHQPPPRSPGPSPAPCLAPGGGCRPRGRGHYWQWRSKSPKHPLLANPKLDRPNQPFSSNRKYWQEKPYSLWWGKTYLALKKWEANSSKHWDIKMLSI